MSLFLGVIIICSALIADAIIGNYQEKVMKTQHASNTEIVRGIIDIFSIRDENNDDFRYFIVLDLDF